MKREKLYFIDFRNSGGSIYGGISGREFIPDKPEHEWEIFSALGKDKNQTIEEIIAKLKSLKEESE